MHKTDEKNNNLETKMETKKALHRKMENAILNILEKRQHGKSCCPSEAARKVDPIQWRDLMPLTREVAKKLRGGGHLEICQRGTVITSDSWTGPIRFRLPTAYCHGNSGSQEMPRKDMSVVHRKRRREMSPSS